MYQYQAMRNASFCLVFFGIVLFVNVGSKHLIQKIFRDGIPRNIMSWSRLITEGSNPIGNKFHIYLFYIEIRNSQFVTFHDVILYFAQCGVHSSFSMHSSFIYKCVGAVCPALPIKLPKVLAYHGIKRIKLHDLCGVQVLPFRISWPPLR